MRSGMYFVLYCFLLKDSEDFKPSISEKPSMPYSMSSAAVDSWKCFPMTSTLKRPSIKYFQKWHRQGIWQTIRTALRHQLWEGVGQAADFSVVIADSQSVTTAEKRVRPIEKSEYLRTIRSFGGFKLASGTFVSSRGCLGGPRVSWRKL